MTDCANVTMREQLPELAAGTLSGAALAAVDAHVAGCAECAAELEVLRDVRAAIRRMTPAMDVAGIARALPAPVGAQASRPMVFPWRIAAAVLFVALGAGSLTLLDRQGDTTAPPTVDTVIAAAPSTVDEGLALTGRIDGMSDRQIRSLIQELEDGIEALPSVEVERVSPDVEVPGLRDVAPSRTDLETE